MIIRRRPFAAILALVALVGSAALMAAPGRVPQTAPTGNASLISVEFRALGDGGTPVLDLKAGDITLKVNGKPREIRDLELVRLPTAQPTSDGKPTPDVMPAYASNAPGDGGRLVYVVVEDESVPSGREQTVRDAVAALDASLSSRDRLGLLITSHGKFDVALTNRHESIATAMKSMVGRAMRSETAEDAGCRTLQSINTMKAVVGALASGTPSAVVFISAGLAPPKSGPVTFSKTMSAAAADTGKTACEVRKDLFDEVGNEAKKGAVDIWVAQVPSDQASTSINSDTLAGIENMAGLTGNPLIKLSADPHADFARLAKESSAYYIATFEADAADRNGTPSRVEVKLSKDALHVRARTEITIPKAAGGAQNATDLLRVANGFKDTPVRAVASAARPATGDELAVMTLFEPVDPTVAFASAAVGLYDDKGKLIRQWSSKPTDLTAIPIMAAVTAKPGVYRQRVAVIDIFGRPGTIDQEVRVELEKGDGQAQMSSLVLGMPFNGSFAPKMLFRAEPSALGYFEVYGVSKTAAVTAVAEVAASENGPTAVSAPARVGQPGADGRRIILGEIPLTSLKPGDYVVRFKVTVDGKAAGTTLRTLRKIGS